MAVLYAGSIVCWAAAARFFGPRAAIAVAVALLVYHGLRPDVPRALERARLRRGLCAAGRCSSRGPPSHRRPDASRSSASASPCSRSCGPGTPFCSPSPSFHCCWPGHGVCGSSGPAHSLLAAVLPLLAWSVHNGVRFDSWGLARGGNAIVPFYRAFITDNIVSPENGEQSRRLARGDAAAPPHPGAIPLVQASRSTSSSSEAASASTRTSTSSPTRSSAGTPTTACSVAPASRGCARTPARMRAA